MRHHQFGERETEKVEKYENAVDTLNDELLADREENNGVHEEEHREEQVNVELADEPAVLRQRADVVEEVEADDYDENEHGDRDEDDLQRCGQHAFVKGFLN